MAGDFGYKKVEFRPPAEPAKKVRVEAPKQSIWSPDRVKRFLARQLTREELRSLDKRDLAEMSKIGYHYLTSGNIDRARLVFDGLVRIDATDPYFYIALGVIAQQKNEHEDADRHYSVALEMHPEAATPLANRGEVRVLLGRLEDGAHDLMLALEIDPEGKEINLQRAKVTLRAVQEQIAAQGKQLRAPVRAKPQAPVRAPSVRGKTRAKVPAVKSGKTAARVPAVRTGKTAARVPAVKTASPQIATARPPAARLPSGDGTNGKPALRGRRPMASAPKKGPTGGPMR